VLLVLVLLVLLFIVGAVEDVVVLPEVLLVAVAPDWPAASI